MLRKISLIFAVVIAFGLAGCSSPETSGESTSLKNSSNKSKSQPEVSKDEQIVLDAQTFIDPFIDDAIDLISPQYRNDLSQDTFAYMPVLEYDELSDRQKTLYDEMYKAAKDFSYLSYSIEDYSYEVFDDVLVAYGALTKDHLDIGTYFMMYEVFSDEGMTTSLETRYFLPFDAEQTPVEDVEILGDELTRFNAISDRIVTRMPADISAYDKYRYLAAVISLVTEYDYEGLSGWQLGSAYGAIAGGHSICQGYTYGFLYLCQKADLWCDDVEGESRGMSHAWSMVKLDNGTYHLDITWSDEGGLPNEEGWMTYFMLTQEDILWDHEITDGSFATGDGVD